MGSGLLSVKSGFILFIKDYQFSLQINTIERESIGICCTALIIQKEFFTTPFLILPTLLGFPDIGIRLHRGEEERGWSPESRSPGFMCR
jgi:hypothetical protein